MPRFFFDLQRDGIVEPDRDGVHLPSLAAAKAEAARTPSIWSETPFRPILPK